MLLYLMMSLSSLNLFSTIFFSFCYSAWLIFITLSSRSLSHSSASLICYWFPQLYFLFKLLNSSALVLFYIIYLFEILTELIYFLFFFPKSSQYPYDHLNFLSGLVLIPILLASCNDSLCLLWVCSLHCLEAWLWLLWIHGWAWLALILALSH